MSVSWVGVGRRPAALALPLPRERRDLASDAPRDLVWRTWTTPELIRRWWAGKRGTVVSAEVDVRVGGRWRYVMTANAGFEVAFHGEFREVVEGERLVTTEVCEGMPDAEAVTR